MNATTQALATNPFAQGKPIAATGAGASDLERASQEVQAAMVVAKRFPRDQISAMDRILQMCTRQTLAESALYSYSRGGADVTGPSIRLAEAMSQGWGNMQCGVRELSQAGGESVIEAFAWDLETNTRVTKVFSVPHIRHTRQGAKALTDPRDIYEAVANQGARRMRACILAVIPGDVTEAAVKQCEITLTSTADTSAEAMKKVVEAFSKFGVSKAHVEKRIQCRLDAIRPAQVVALRKIYASLKDGMSQPGDWFEMDAPAEAPAPRRKSEAKPQPKPEPPATITPEQAQQIVDALEQFGIEREAFCAELGCESVETLPADLFEPAMAWVVPAEEAE